MSSKGTETLGQSIKKRRFVDKLLSAPVGATAAALMLAIFMGCMSLEIGNRKVEVETPHCEEGVLFQQGEAHVPANCTRFVHYPIPYPRKPNIEISTTFDDCVIAEEREDGFLLRNPNAFSRKVTWKARGMRCEPPPATPAAPLPPAPVPVTPTLPTPTPERDN
ncbi:MAG TPA: hypothetical protein VE999_03220 [Gemmataceae bacterium]|nr:hypothetical protein [Gemmataceae bacterium]